MNLEKLDLFYPWIDIHKLRNQLTLCLDKNNGNGEFTFVYTMLIMLKKKNISVKLLCFNHNFNHYASILRKNNIDFSKLEYEGKLEIIFVTLDNNIERELKTKSWDELIEWQNSYLSLNNENSSSFENAVLLDDLDMLELVAPNPIIARRFVGRFLSKINKEDNSLCVNSIPINYMVAFGRHPQDTISQFYSANKYTSELMRYADQHDFQSFSAALPLDEENQPILSEYLRYRADITITISGLETGYSSVVHGIISILRKDQFPKKQILHYKALDSGVLCNLVGDSF